MDKSFYKDFNSKEILNKNEDILYYNKKIENIKEPIEINKYKNEYLYNTKGMSFEELLSTIRAMNDSMRSAEKTSESTPQFTAETTIKADEDEIYAVKTKLTNALAIVGNAYGSATYLSKIEGDKTKVAEKTGNVLINFVPATSTTFQPFYKFDRGAIVFSKDGEKAIEILDDTYNHHADATNRLAGKFNVFVDSQEPYKAGVESATEGLVVMQLEGDNGLVYLPNEISVSQIDKIIDEIAPRNMFSFNVYQNGMIFDDDYNAHDLLSFLNDYLDKSLNNGIGTRIA